MNELLAFAGGGWAFRAPQRAAARALLVATLQAARANGWRLGAADALAEADALGSAAAEGGSLATPVVAAALAATRAARAPGATLLDAIVAGAEVALRLADALHGHVERGWDVRGSAGRIGAALAAGRALGLGREALRDAFGLAATAAGGLATDDASARAFVVGSAAADGVEAALLARAGMTSAPLALEGRRGLVALMSDGLDRERLLADLGRVYRIDALGGDDVAGDEALRHAIAALSAAPSLDALSAVLR